MRWALLFITGLALLFIIGLALPPLRSSALPIGILKSAFRLWSAPRHQPWQTGKNYYKQAFIGYLYYHICPVLLFFTQLEHLHFRQTGIKKLLFVIRENIAISNAITSLSFFPSLSNFQDMLVLPELKFLTDISYIRHQLFPIIATSVLF